MDNLGMAMQELFDEQTAELLQDIDRSEPHIFSRRHEKKMQKLFKRQRKPYFKFICTASRRAACIAAAIVIVSASAMSTLLSVWNSRCSTSPLPKVYPLNTA